MGLKLIQISKRGNWWSNPLDITLVVLTINCLCKTFPDFAIKVLCFLTTINLTFKFQLMVHEKLSWRNCKCPVDLWQPGQIVLKKFHPSKNPEWGWKVFHKDCIHTGILANTLKQCSWKSSDTSDISTLGWRALKTPTSETRVSAVTWPRSRFKTCGPDPLGVWLGGPGCKPGGAVGGQSGRPPIK